MARRRSGRKIDGILIVDKPPEWSSNDVVQRVKRLYKAQKVGHTGSLDPLATGVLPLCLGEATKFSQYLLDSDKRYWTRVALGVRTTTSDADGEVCETHDASHITAADVEAKLVDKYLMYMQVISHQMIQDVHCTGIGRMSLTVYSRPSSILLIAW